MIFSGFIPRWGICQGGSKKKHQSIQKNTTPKPQSVQGKMVPKYREQMQNLAHFHNTLWTDWEVALPYHGVFSLLPVSLFVKSGRMLSSLRQIGVFLALVHS